MNVVSFLSLGYVDLCYIFAMCLLPSMAKSQMPIDPNTQKQSNSNPHLFADIPFSLSYLIYSITQDHSVRKTKVYDIGEGCLLVIGRSVGVIIINLELYQLAHCDPHLNVLDVKVLIHFNCCTLILLIKVPVP